MVKKNIVTIKHGEIIKNYESRCIDLIAEASMDKKSKDFVQALAVDLAKNLKHMRSDETSSFSRIKYLCQQGETPMFFNDEAFSLLVEADQDGHDLNVVVLSEDGSSLGLISNKDLLW